MLARVAALRTVRATSPARPSAGLTRAQIFCRARQVAARPAPALFARGLAGPVKVHEVSQEDVYGPAEVARTEAKIEMGVRYEAGVPSPMEGAHYNEPIVVDGLVAKTGGDGLGCPVQYIKLSAWYACCPSPTGWHLAASLRAHGDRAHAPFAASCPGIRRRSSASTRG